MSECLLALSQVEIAKKTLAHAQKAINQSNDRSFAQRVEFMRKSIRNNSAANKITASKGK
jgi:hypothetical protein